MAIILDDGLKVGQQKPVDSKYFNDLVPYASVAEANTTLTVGVRHIGLTVNIAGVEYWYKGGIEDVNLVIKSITNTYTIKYVDSAATGGTGDGSSWANAITSLQTALSGATSYTTFYVKGTHIFTSKVTCLVGNIDVIGIWDSITNLYPSISSNTTTYVDLIEFRGSNIKFKGFNILGKGVSKLIYFSGSSTSFLRNICVNDLIFKDANADANKDPITGTIITTSLLSLLYVADAEITSIKIENCTVTGSHIRLNNCNSILIDGLSVYNSTLSTDVGGSIVSTDTLGATFRNILASNCNKLGTRYYRAIYASINSKITINNLVMEGCKSTYPIYVNGSISSSIAVQLSNSLFKNNIVGWSILGIGNLGVNDSIIANNITTKGNSTMIGTSMSSLRIASSTGSITLNNSILQEDIIIYNSSYSDRYILNNSYLSITQQYSEVRNNCIVGSDPKFVSSTDLRLYSDTLVPITTSTEIDKYNTNYEQYVDLNNTPYNRNAVVAGAYQEVVYGSEAPAGGVTISDTYVNIKALADAGSLVPESTYIITDFQTKYTQLETLLVKTGPIEPLTLIAATTTTFYEEVSSSLFPKDEILYDINGTTNYYSEPTPLVADKGVITWRKDDKDNSTGYDHRVILWRRNSTDVLTFGTANYNNIVGAKRNMQANVSPRDNVFGVGCYNNVFGSFTWSNTVDYGAGNNQVSGEFHNNIIGGNFKHNIIGDSFSFNTTGIEFKRNHILNSCYFNNFGSNFSSNTIGNNFQTNTIGDDCYSNTIGNNFQTNTIGDDCYSNTIGDGFRSNTIDGSFHSNTIGDGFRSNTIGYGFYSNTIGDGFQINAIGNNFQYNTIGNDFYYNTIKDDFNSNKIGDNFFYNKIGNDFQNNEVKNNITNTNWLNAVPTPIHVYSSYDCKIFKNSADVSRLSYYNENDESIITNITA